MTRSFWLLILVGSMWAQTAKPEPVSGELVWGVDLTGNRAAKVD